MNHLRKLLHWVMGASGLDRRINAGQVNHWLEVRGQRRQVVMDAEATNRWLGEVVVKGEPAAVGKLGSSECWALAWHLRISRFYKYTWASPSFGELDLAEQSGVFPNTEEVFHRFAELYLQRLRALDGAVVWQNPGEGEILRKFASAARWGTIQGLEPYFFATPWSRELAGKKVLVVHPFEETIRAQFPRRRQIWGERDGILPDCEIEVIRAPYGFAKNRFQDWFAMLGWLEGEVEKAYARHHWDVALIGCGAAGIPLAAQVKQLGGIGIHLGGPLQLLFGIRGRRWDGQPEFQRHFNEHWVRPRPEETPEVAPKVDNGGYW